MTRHAEVLAVHLLNTALESTEAPRARVCFLEMFSVFPASSAGSPFGQDGGVSPVERTASSVQDLSRRRACLSALTRETRLDEVRTWSDLSFAIGSSSAVTPGRGPDIHPLLTPDREFVPGVVCQR